MGNKDKGRPEAKKKPQPKPPKNATRKDVNQTTVRIVRDATEKT
jgi:hypothetical protein